MWLSGTGGEYMRQRRRSQKSAQKNKKNKVTNSEVKILDKRSNSNRKPRTSQQPATQYSAECLYIGSPPGPTLIGLNHYRVIKQPQTNQTTL